MLALHPEILYVSLQGSSWLTCWTSLLDIPVLNWWWSTFNRLEESPLSDRMSCWKWSRGETNLQTWNRTLIWYHYWKDPPPYHQCFSILLTKGKTPLNLDKDCKCTIYWSYGLKNVKWKYQQQHFCNMIKNMTFSGWCYIKILRNSHPLKQGWLIC